LHGVWTQVQGNNIINDIYRAQNSQVQQMRQVSCCMITVILEQEHFQSFPEYVYDVPCLRNSREVSAYTLYF